MKPSELGFFFSCGVDSSAVFSREVNRSRAVCKTSGKRTEPRNWPRTRLPTSTSQPVGATYSGRVESTRGRAIRGGGGSLWLTATWPGQAASHAPPRWIGALFFSRGAHAGRRERSGSRGNHRFFLFLRRFYSVFAPLHRFSPISFRLL
jgi:hypothetical protein